MIQKEKEDGTFERDMEERKRRTALKDDRQNILLKDASLLTAFVCHECKFATATEDDLRFHVEKNHSRSAKSKMESSGEQGWRAYNPKRQCDQCSFFGFNMSEHLRQHHDPNLPHGCDSCGYRALTPMAINMHKAKLHTEKKHQCTLGCGKMFKDPWYRTRHEERYCVNSAEREEWKQKEETSGRAAMERVKRQERKRERKQKYKNLKELKETMNS